jgi:hypothetical protein
MVERISLAFKEAGIPWWADYGTLMGAVRNPLTKWSDYPWLPQDGRETEGPAPGIVPHDKDADVGVLMADWHRASRVRVTLIRKFGYAMTANYARGSMKLRLSSRNHTNVDVFYWHERANGMLYRTGYAQVDQFKGREFPKSILFPLSSVEFEGMKIPAPRDPEAFLEMRYGPNWRTPIKANNDGVSRGQWNGKRNSRG